MNKGDCGLLDCPLYNMDADGCDLTHCYLDDSKRTEECIKAEKEYEKNSNN